MQKSSGGMNWLGEGFDGLQKRLPEDCVEYSIYFIDTHLDETARKEQLRLFQSAADRLTKPLVKDFIWQKEDFVLGVVVEDGLSLLRGRTSYGDSVDDEWLIVYILRELSKQFSMAWIRIIDADGEFLLIEAANALPQWLNPENATNRVWINGGRLLVVPLRKDPDKSSSKPKVTPNAIDIVEAHEFILNQKSNFIHSPEVETEAFFKLQKYPGHVAGSLHRAAVLIPRNLAFILHEKAAYVSAATEAFYLRDPISVRPWQGHSKRELIFPPKDLGVSVVKFTKVGYAQLRSQEFAAPTIWESTISSVGSERSMIQALTGMKLSCGFEILMTDPKYQDDKATREIKLLLEDLEADNSLLPSTKEIENWESVEDDETWLDINFEDFDRELSRKGPRKSSLGFGDKTAQENLSKMVDRFQDFLNDDSAGAEGAVFADDMDNDNDTDEMSDMSTEDEDRKVKFNEEDFADMMRVMMGISKKNVEDDACATPPAVDVALAMPHEVNDEGFESDEEEIRRVAREVEAELRHAGALQLNPPSAGSGRRKQMEADLKTNQSGGEASDSNSDEGSEVNVDYNLAKNMLESFKSQAGMAGPGSNLMGLMGIDMPLDEEERQHGSDKRQPS